MSDWNGKQMFPCPVCTQPREVRVTKKGKPYLVCDPCGVQVFIRGPAGIAEFDRLCEQACPEGIVPRLQEMGRRYRLICPECGKPFWIEPKLVKTGMLDGTFKGFKCPQERCKAIVPWEEKQ